MNVQFNFLIWFLLPRVGECFATICHDLGYKRLWDVPGMKMECPYKRDMYSVQFCNILYMKKPVFK